MTDPAPEPALVFGHSTFARPLVHAWLPEPPVYLRSVCGITLPATLVTRYPHRPTRGTVTWCEICRVLTADTLDEVPRYLMRQSRVDGSRHLLPTHLPGDGHPRALCGHDLTGRPARWRASALACATCLDRAQQGDTTP